MYSLYLRECIIRLSQHYKGKAFQARLQEERFTVSLSGAYYLIKKLVQFLIGHAVDNQKYFLHQHFNRLIAG